MKCHDTDSDIIVYNLFSTQQPEYILKRGGGIRSCLSSIPDPPKSLPFTQSKSQSPCNGLQGPTSFDSLPHLWPPLLKPATLFSLLFLKTTKHTPASGPLHTPDLYLESFRSTQPHNMLQFSAQMSFYQGVLPWPPYKIAATPILPSTLYPFLLSTLSPSTTWQDLLYCVFGHSPMRRAILPDTQRRLNKHVLSARMSKRIRLLTPQG